MADISGDSAARGAPTSSRAELDREWWGEPDPVEVFAAGLELSLRQLRVDIAGLRAERDGLRLEVEGLRAKLAIAQEQLAQRDSLSDTVRQLQAAVGRLTLGAAAPPAPQVEEPEPAAGSPVVLPTAEPMMVPPPAEIVVEPPPSPAADVAPAPAEEAAPTEPTALEQLEAMGLWPPRPAALGRDAPRRAADDVATSDVDAQTPPPSAAAPVHEGVHWDRLSTRRTPVVQDARPSDLDDADLLEAQRPTRRGRRVLTAVMLVLGAVVIVSVLLVSVGPRLLPYQTYFVRSGSMEPTIQTGAMVVLTKTDTSELVPGDIITFKNPLDPSVLVTHRIVEVETDLQGRVFITKGDANLQPDPWRVPAIGSGWRYAFNVPIIGYVFGVLAGPQVRVALIVIPAAVLGVLALLDIWRPRDKER